jgi:NADH:ubiquinone reductase (H+-translocating)
MNQMSHQPRVLVVGGGFAGIAVVKELLRQKAPAAITLVSKSELFEYYPGLYKLVTGTMPMEVSLKLHTIFPEGSVNIIKGVYTELDQSRQIIRLEGGIELPYDYLILAVGSETNYFGIPGLEKLSFSFKSVAEALRLKAHFCNLFSNTADLSRDELVSRFHVIVVGGGPSGVELAGDLRHYLWRLAREHAVDPSLVTIDLIESGPRVLPAFPEKASRAAEARLRKMGVNIFTNRALASQDIAAITTSDLNMHSHTVIWSAGTKVNPAFAAIPGVVMNERRRVSVTPSLTLTTDNHVFIAGDGAGTPYSGLAQTAIHNGTYIGKTIARLLRNKTPGAYVPHQPSFVIPIGARWAIFNHGSFVFTGFIPWLLRSAIDVRYFSSIVSPRHVVSMMRKGRRYRKVYGGCSPEQHI